MADKVLIFGFDGGSWNLLDELIRDDYMPHLSELRSKSASGNLISTIPPQTPVAWGSFQTGMKPGNLGYVDFTTLDLTKKSLGLVTGKNLPGTIWEYFSGHDKKVVSINVPMTYPPREVNGAIISGMLTPDLDSDFIYPKFMKEKLLKHLPDYNIFNLSGIKQEFSYRDLDRYLLELRKVIDIRQEAARFMMKEIEPDLMMVHFQVTDILQHPYWKFIDKSHPEYREEFYHNIGENFYRYLDLRVHELMNDFRTITDNPGFAVISDHGFQAHKARFNLGDFLEVKGLCPRNRQNINSLRNLFIRLIRKLDVFRIMPELFGKSWLQTVESATQPILWSRSKLIAIGRSSYGFIYLNPEIIEESDRLKFLKEIKQLIYSINDLGPDRIIKDIFLKKELYYGRKLDKMPDLLIVPEPGYTFSGSFSDRDKGNIQVRDLDDFHQGIHRLQGIYVMNGDQIDPGFNSDISIADIFPNLCRVMGVPVPEVDGTVQEELFR